MSATSPRTVAVFSRGIHRLPQLTSFLGAERLVFSPGSGADVDVVVGWGKTRTAEPARQFAEREGKPYWRLEDGFLRSVRSGPNVAPLSLVVDDVGIYYDARAPSAIERFLSSDGSFDDALRRRAAGLLERVRDARLSKYNDQGGLRSPNIEALGDDYVLVVDQTFGDLSVEGGLVPKDGFTRMLEAALTENPGARVVVKVHPDVIAGRKRGYLTEIAQDRVVVVGENVHPHLLVERARSVYVCTSQLGFEALLHGRPVRCFGMPFYAGWGLTLDEFGCERRKVRRSLVELAAAAWLGCARYVHPVRRERCEAEEIVEHLVLQRRRFSANAGATRAIGFARWKERYVASYLASPDGRLVFGGQPKPGERVLLWGRLDSKVAARAQEAGASVALMEDGFLRSLGLGSDLTRPRSLVVDSVGLHYDPSAPSGLERLLTEKQFNAEEIERARRLRARIVESGISKYNADPAAARSLDLPNDRRVVLVIGQVEDDASIVLGAGGLDNSALVRATREVRPEAFLVYKPHPDVVSGNRRGRLTPEVTGLVDHVETASPISTCLSFAHEVHTLTSLVGFEALLRGLPVFVYGSPFYAGWGITNDRVPVPRRTRKLTLDELVAGTLIDYPVYYSFQAGAFVTAEDVVFELIRDRSTASPLPASASRAARQLGRLRRWLAEVFVAR